MAEIRSLVFPIEMYIAMGKTNTSKRTKKERILLNRKHIVEPIKTTEKIRVFPQIKIEAKIIILRNTKKKFTESTSHKPFFHGNSKNRTGAVNSPCPILAKESQITTINLKRKELFLSLLQFLCRMSFFFLLIRKKLPNLKQNLMLIN